MTSVLNETFRSAFGPGRGTGEDRALAALIARAQAGELEPLHAYLQQAVLDEDYRMAAGRAGQQPLSAEDGLVALSELLIARQRERWGQRAAELLSLFGETADLDAKTETLWESVASWSQDQLFCDAAIYLEDGSLDWWSDWLDATQLPAALGLMFSDRFATLGAQRALGRVFTPGQLQALLDELATGLGPNASASDALAACAALDDHDWWQIFQEFGHKHELIQHETTPGQVLPLSPQTPDTEIRLAFRRAVIDQAAER